MIIHLADASSTAYAAYAEYLTIRRSRGLPTHTAPPMLFSFWYAWKKKSGDKVMEMLRSADAPKILLDSGVFSARKHDVIIPTRDLIDFYHRFPDVIGNVFSMDSGTQDEQVAKAQEMADAGVPVVPIYHGDMPLDYIDRLSEVRDYIAVSFWYCGGPARKPENVQRYLDRIFNHIDKAGLWPLKVHALGTEQPKLLKRYPFYSCDSTGYVTDYAYYKMKRWCPRAMKLKPLPDYFRSVQDTRHKRVFKAIDLRVQLQSYLTQVWKERGIEWPAN